MRPRLPGLLGALAAIASARGVAAQSAPVAPAGALTEEEAAVFDAPAPPTLPALTRRDLTFTFEITAAMLEYDPHRTGNDSYAWSAHGELELPVVPRRWFIGAAHEVATAAVPGVDRHIVAGNPEIWGRGVWSSVRGLSSGGGLGVVVPIPRNLTQPEQDVLATVRTVRPWDAVYYSDLTMVVRPWFDIRHVTGPFIFQFRQGLDWSVLLREARSTERPIELAARATFYFGFRATRSIGLGLELWEVYQLTEKTKGDDSARAAFAISPSIRFMFPLVQPALSVLFPIATPLRGQVDTYYAARLNVGFSFPTGRRAEPDPGL